MDPIFRLLHCSEEYQKNSSSNYTIMMLCQNLDKIPSLTIDGIADLCNTNPMAISRTVRKLGYKNFAEFRSATIETVSQYKYLNRNIPMEFVNSENPSISFLDYVDLIVKELRTSSIIEDIGNACELIHNSDHIHYYGPPFHSVSVTMFLHDLIVDGKNIHPYTSRENILLDMQEIRKGSLILLLPNDLSVNTELAHKIMDTAEQKEANIIIHTQRGNSLLSFSKGPNLAYPGDNTAASVISSNFVLNMLTMTYRNKYIDKH